MATVTENKMPTASESQDSTTRTRFFRVVLDNYTNDAAKKAVDLIKADQNLFIGAPYSYGNEFDISTLCSRFVPRPVSDNRLHYDVQVVFDSSQTEANDNPDDPTDLRGMWMNGESRAVPSKTVKDMDGELIVNAAGVNPWGLVETDKMVLIRRWKTNVLRQDIAFDESYADGWNRDPFLGRPKRSVHVTSITYSGEQTWPRSNVIYFERTIEFEFYPEEHFEEFPNISLYALFVDDNGNEKLSAITEKIVELASENNDAESQKLSNATGERVAQPQFLGADGYIATRATRENVPEELIVSLQIGREVSFSGILDGG